MDTKEPNGWGLWMVWTFLLGSHHLRYPRPHVAAIFNLSPHEELGSILPPPDSITEKMMARVSRVVERGRVDSTEKQVYLFIPGRWFLKQWLINIFKGKFRRSLWAVLSQFKIRTVSTYL